MRITSKGQVTIPQEIREELGLLPNTEVDIHGSCGTSPMNSTLIDSNVLIDLSPLPDFFIGAHAAVAGHTLLTRDPRRYRDYFPKPRIISP